MASITQLKNGLKRIDFYDGKGDRKSIRIGKMSVRDAEKIQGKIAELNAAAINGTTIEPELAKWLADRPAKLYGKLVKVGLAKPREESVTVSTTLGPFLADFIAKHSDVKETTTTVYGRWQKKLNEFFGENKPIEQINVAEAKDFKRWLKTDKKLAKNTIARGCGVASQFFEDAWERELIPKNPFKKLPEQVTGNKSREFFLEDADAKRVLAAAKNPFYAAIFALARYGGLRTPSEPYGLRWEDIYWERNRFLVRSPKTEQHEGKAERKVPLFPELRPYLEALYDAIVIETGKAPDPKAYVIARCRSSNPATNMKKIIRRAGLTPWPKLFQNLRSTRETELVQEGHPLHVVCDWIGNSALIAKRHYLQVTDADFAKAAGEKAQRKAQLSGASGDDTARHGVTQNSEFPEEHAKTLCSACDQMGGTGLEPVTSWV
jgi:integrase